MLFNILEVVANVCNQENKIAKIIKWENSREILETKETRI